MSRFIKFCPRCAKPLESGLEGGRTRLRCPDRKCGFVHWDNPTPVVAAIVEQDGEVILARNALWPEKMFGLVTGFLERDESPEQGLIREVEEEIGLKARDPKFVGHYLFPQMNQLILAYHVVGEGEVKLGEEIVEFKRVPPARLRPWPTGTGHAVRDWLISRGFTPQEGLISPLHGIFGFLPLGPRIGSAGQPAAEQFAAIKEAGYRSVINLALDTSDGALPDEEGIVRGHGMDYVHIPVDFDAPTAEDLERFCAAMDARAEQKVFVHCAANKRVSAFLFLYRVLRLGQPIAEAEPALRRIWQPNDVWQRFIDEQLARPGK